VTSPERWIGGHGRLVRLGSALVALVLVLGGIALGMAGASGTDAAPICEGCPAPRVVAPTRHYVVGTVALVTAPGRFIVRTNAGRFVLVERDAATAVRRTGKGKNVRSLARGVRVVILGEPRNGHLNADVVTITGPAATRPATAPPPGIPAPVRTAVPVRS
jgi:hypothetical protein